MREFITLININIFKKYCESKKKLDFYLLSNKYENSLYIKTCHLKMYETLKEIIEIFSKNNIKYFMMSGSLLGLRRNNKIIPYDNDIDIGIMINDYDKVLKLGYKEKRNGKNKCGFTYKMIDIFTFNFYDNNEISLHFNKFRASFINEYFYKDELFPLKKKLFGKILVTIPNNPDKYLYRAFGKDCLCNKKIKYSKIPRNDPNLPISSNDLKYIIYYQKFKTIFNLKNIIYYTKYDNDIFYYIFIASILFFLFCFLF